VRAANKTNYTSYPDPGSAECIEFNGSMGGAVRCVQREDCNGCCRQNQGDAEQLIDIEQGRALGRPRRPHRMG
jgi:hypothetical protein